MNLSRSNYVWSRGEVKGTNKGVEGTGEEQQKDIVTIPRAKGQGEEQSYRSPVGTTTVEKRPSSRSCIIEKYITVLKQRVGKKC